MLLLIIGAGIYDNLDSWFGDRGTVETQVQPEQMSVEPEIVIEDTEVSSEQIEEVLSEDAETVLDVIPVEVISGEGQGE